MQVDTNPAAPLGTRFSIVGPNAINRPEASIACVSFVTFSPVEGNPSWVMNRSSTTRVESFLRTLADREGG